MEIRQEVMSIHDLKLEFLFKADLGFAQRASLEKQVAKKQGAIKKIAKKLFPSVKQADRDKLKKQKAEQSVLDRMGK